MTEIITKSLWALFGLYAAWMAHDLGVGTLNEPGPGLMVFGLGSVVVMASLGSLALTSFKRKRAGGVPDEAAEPLQWPGLWRVVCLLAMMLVYIAVLESIGFLLATAVFLLVLLVTLGGVKWPRAFTIAVIVALVAYYGFSRGLGVQLPIGILG